jgi:squalene-hopene/tetraprenyl-beta-curcumene cyclase
MVSYALPALIAVGQVGHHHRPSRNPLWRSLRDRLRPRTLALLERIQPASGGFLEAAPLTSFVVMSLVGCGQAAHPVAERGIAFLADTVRGDGSWPIDTNLSTWLTTTALQSLAAGGRLAGLLSPSERDRILSRLLDGQHLSEHPYTHAAPGGWAWTDLSGGVPDADDTSGALLAARALAPDDARVRERAALGVGWLLDLQNRDGGVPTFCRGWTRLPFDRSSPDITAHALRAWSRWRAALDAVLGERIAAASERALRYLVREQRHDGAWVPLWFGNQHAPRLENPVYGTARVLLAGEVTAGEDAAGAWSEALARGRRWLLSAQNPDGGWGGGAEPSSIEETALAIEALAGGSGAEAEALDRALEWLQRATREGTSFEAAPIGLYFARLWYSERLYPLLFSVAALERACGTALPSQAPDPDPVPHEVPA